MAVGVGVFAGLGVIDGAGVSFGFTVNCVVALTPLYAAVTVQAPGFWLV